MIYLLSGCLLWILSAGSDVVNMYSLDGHECVQVILDQKSRQYVDNFAASDLHAGACSEHGFTVDVPDGRSLLRLPFMSEPVVLTRLKRPAWQAGKLKAEAFLFNPLLRLAGMAGGVSVPVVQEPIRKRLSMNPFPFRPAPDSKDSSDKRRPFLAGKKSDGAESAKASQSSGFLRFFGEPDVHPAGSKFDFASLISNAIPVDKKDDTATPGTIKTYDHAWHGIFSKAFHSSQEYADNPEPPPVGNKYVPAGSKTGFVQVISGIPSIVMGAPATYDEQQAKTFTEFAFAFGENASSTESWSCGEFCDSTRHLLSKDSKIHFLGPGGKWHAQGYVLKLANKGCLLAFRGSVDLQNYLADAYFTSKHWPPTGRDSWCPDCRVHSGFADAYEELFPKMKEGLEDLQCKDISVTGHSLGGALASLAAAELRSRGETPVSKVYTFGSPRVGNPAFVKAFTDVSLKDGNIPPQWRIVHGNDLVPRMVPTMGGLGGVLDYAHIGKEVHYNKDSSAYKVAIDDQEAKGHDDPRDVSSAPVWMWTFLDHLNYLNRTWITDSKTKEKMGLNEAVIV